MRLSRRHPALAGEEDRHHQGRQGNHRLGLEGRAPGCIVPGRKRSDFVNLKPNCFNIVAEAPWQTSVQEAKGLADNPGKLLEGKPKEACEDAVPWVVLGLKAGAGALALPRALGPDFCPRLE